MKKHKGSTSSDWEVILLGADSTEIKASEYRAKQKGVFGADFLVLSKKQNKTKNWKQSIKHQKGIMNTYVFPVVWNNMLH